MTPYAWLKRLRLEQSKRLLGSGLPVSEVALAVGFFDQSHFHHGFRQVRPHPRRFSPADAGRHWAHRLTPRCNLYNPAPLRSAML
jgi:AraC-like DNA-binding protein